MRVNTLYVKQNIITLAHLRQGVEFIEPFDTTNGEAVQKAWDAGQNMHSLSGGRHYLNKNIIGPSTRICFVCKDYFRFLTNPEHSESGERLDGNQACPQYDLVES